MPVFRTRNFELTSGAVLADLEIAYECYGKMAADKSNVILVAHGITSSHHAAGEITPDRRRGWWSEVIGPNKVFDTNRYCIVSSNALGSCYGSTGPRSIDPATGRPFGPNFPAFNYEDIVTAQHMMLRSLGVENLVAVAGASLGGFQAFQWAVTFPDFMAGVIAMDTAPRDLFESAATASRLFDDLSKDPNWNGADYYAQGGMEKILTELRVRTLRSYGFEEKLKDVSDEGEREALLLETAREWAREFDANSLIATHNAMASFNVEDDLPKIHARLFYILADTDEWFPASIGKEVMERLEAAGVDATFLEITSPYGHYATTEEPGKWTPQVEDFLRQLSTIVPGCARSPL